MKLSKRELQLARGVFDDKTEFAIAVELGISPRTVHTHSERRPYFLGRRHVLEATASLERDYTKLHTLQVVCGDDFTWPVYFCPERTSRAKRDIEAKRAEDPSELLYSFEQWEKVLGSIIADYNGSEQDGEILQGMSPNEAFDAFWPVDDPPKSFDASCWHLCAHYMTKRPVTENGITFKIGKNRFTYRDKQTSRDRGETVLAWFDPAHPEFLGVTDSPGDHKRRNGACSETLCSHSAISHCALSRW